VLTLSAMRGSANLPTKAQQRTGKAKAAPCHPPALRAGLCNTLARLPANGAIPIPGNSLARACLTVDARQS